MGKLKKTQEKTTIVESAGVVSARLETRLREDAMSRIKSRMAGVLESYAKLLDSHSTSSKARAAEGDAFDAYYGKDLAVNKADMRAHDKALSRISAAKEAAEDYAAALAELAEELQADRDGLKEKVDATLE